MNDETKAAVAELRDEIRVSMGHICLSDEHAEILLARIDGEPARIAEAVAAARAELEARSREWTEAQHVFLAAESEVERLEESNQNMIDSEALLLNRIAELEAHAKSKEKRADEFEVRVRELEELIRESDEQAAREAEEFRLIRDDTNAWIRTCLSPERRGDLWGPELEALGRGVDSLKARISELEAYAKLADAGAELEEKRADELEARVKELKVEIERFETNGRTERACHKLNAEIANRAISHAEAQRDEAIAALRALVSAEAALLGRGEDTTPGDFERAWAGACALLAKHPEAK